MKRTTAPADLFANLPEPTSRPKLVVQEPTTPAELASLQAQLWETAPQHVLGVIRGVQCVYLEAFWHPIAELAPADLITCFSLS
jgi:hypothetical protein